MIYESEGDFSVIYAAIKRLAWQILPDRVEDLTQDVALKLWSRRTSLPVRFHGNYLRRIVRNAAYDFLRKERKQMMQRSLILNEDGSIGSETNSRKIFLVAEPACDYSDESDDLSSLYDSLQNLPPEQRKAIALKATGLKDAEIAEKQGVTAVTARTRIHYARKKLQRVLEAAK